MQVNVQSLSITYEQKGDTTRPGLLILPGWSDGIAGWQDMQARFAARYNTIVLDLPGFGESQAPKTDWDLNDYARFVGAFLRKLRFKPSIIVGHSNGGAIAMRGLANNDFTADRLVLLASSGLRSEYKGRNKALRAVIKTGKILTTPLPRSLKKRLRHTVYQTAGADMLVREDLQESFKRIVTDDIQASAARLNLPTLLVYGEDDELTPVRYGRIFHTLIDSSKLEIVTAAGHFVHVDQPATVERLVGEFLA